MRKILIYILAVFSLAGCKEYDINEVLLVHTDVSLSQKGKTQYIFTPATGQMSCNAEKTLYRYLDDNLSSWMEVNFQNRPGSSGDKVIADIKWKYKSSNGDLKRLEFEIQQTDNTGMIWLWDSTNNIGLIIRDFE